MKNTDGRQAKICYGFMDESGAPGVASYRKDCFVVSLVVFDREKSRDENIEKIEELCRKLKLPDYYEFHCSSNSTKPQTEFIKLLAKLDFRFLTVAIHKDNNRKTATYARIVELMMKEVERRFTDIRIDMDCNPVLYKEFCKYAKGHRLRGVKFRQYNSRSSRMIQMADYVANISAKRAKGVPRADEWYKYIAKKEMAFIEV